MLHRLSLTLVAFLALLAPAFAQDKPNVRVPDLTVFNDGAEMIGALSALGLHGRITAMDAPSADQEGKFGQLPAAGTMLPVGGEVLIFRYGKYVPPETAATKPADPAGQPNGGLEGMIAGSEQDFIGNFAGMMQAGGAETPVTVGISNSGTWSIIVGTDTGTIGGRTGPGEETRMEGGMLTYRLEGPTYQSTLSVKVSGDDLLGTLTTVLGTGDFAQRTEATIRATRTK